MNNIFSANQPAGETPEAGPLGGAIAIIGLSGRFPGARNLDEFWRNLQGGVESVRFFSEEELLQAGVDPELARRPGYVKAKAMLEDAELFDAAFFGLSPREAEVIDPQHRLFLMEAWAALEHAGCDPQRYGGAIGVYAGVSMNTYALSNLAGRPELLREVGAYQLMLGNDKDFMPTRVSYKLGLRGPSVLVQTACSTSLAAVQLACQALLGRQCDAALAGGACVYAQRQAGYLYQPGMILSPDGHCRAFDARGQGIVAGEGVGVVVLKRLAEALAEGDTIHAVIRGAALNNDGANKVGYTAPSVEGQAEAIALALAQAGTPPETISYVECHGTGTPLGDPIEIAALTQAFRAATDKKGFCAVGSVKTNIGHLDAAAGVAGLIKTVLALKNRQIPPSLHFSAPNPQIDFENSPFRVSDQLRDWTPPPGAPRRAGVSSFGIGGTNAHVVLEEAPPPAASAPSRPWALLTLSARTASALETMSEELAAFLQEHPQTELADAAWTLQTGRQAFSQRRAAAARTAEEAAAALAGRDAQAVFSGAPAGGGAPAIAFLFTGQGAQYAGMGRGLYQSETLFREIVDECAGRLRGALGLDLREVMLPAPEKMEEAAALLDQTRLTQPALFTLEYALARQLQAWGVRPQAMLGHSIGEYAAACLAGVFTLEDALAVVAERGRLMQAMEPGAMLAVGLGERELEGRLAPELTIAAVNAPALCVVSGPLAAAERLQAQLEAQNVLCRRLRTSHAYHSAMMEPALPPFRALLEKLTLHAPQLPFISNVSGTWITAAEAADPGYWARHLRAAVRFEDGLGELLRRPGCALLEVGPGRTLLGLARQHASWSANVTALSTTPHAEERDADAARHLVAAVGRLWVAGAAVDWEAFNGPGRRRRVPLPTYPFQCQRYWIDPAAPAPPARRETAAEPLKRSDMSGWFYVPGWRRTAPPEALPPQEREAGRRDWLIFADDCGLAEQLAERLERAGDRAVRVTPGEGFRSRGAGRYAIDPAAPADYEALLGELRQAGREPRRVIHAWSVSAPGAEGEDPLARCERAQRLGFFSLLGLMQAYDKAWPGRPLRLDALSNGMQDVGGEGLPCPEKATLLGPVRTIPFEFPAAETRSIDVSWDGERPDGRLVEQLLAELDAASEDQVVACRNGLRWAQTYEAAPQPPAREAAAGLKRKGVYLITGGLGGIGLTVAEHFARAAQARLALIGRTAPPPREQWEKLLSAADAETGGGAAAAQIRALRRLEEAGGEALIIQADVADPGQIRKAVEAARARFGRLDGVFHGAGAPGGGIMQLKTIEQAARVLAPKVRGALALEAALAGEKLDFFITCSSITAALSWAGQVDYCAANAFLDAFAASRHRPGGTRHVAIGWDAWREVGMALKTEVPAHLAEAKARNLRNGIASAEGVEALARILGRPLPPQVLVSTMDLAARLAQARDFKAQIRAPGGEKEAPASAAAPAPSAGATHPRPNLPYPCAPPQGETQSLLADIWRALLGLDEVGARDNFFDLGGHSLLATQLLSRLRERFQAELPLRAIFEAPTVAELAERIEALRWAGEGRQAALAASGEREEIEL